MRKARNGNCSRSHFLEKTQKRLSHNKSMTAEGIQEKGRSNNASLNYGHLNYSHLPRAHNKRNDKFESALYIVLYCNNNSDEINKQELASLTLRRNEIFNKFLNLLHSTHTHKSYSQLSI